MKSRTRHALTFGTVAAGLATEVFFGLGEHSVGVIAAEGLACFLGAPGAGLLLGGAARAAGTALTGLGINLFSSELTASKDDGLNHDLYRASGKAIAAIVRDEAPKHASLRPKKHQLEKLAAEIERLHQPAVLDEVSGSASPVDPGEVLADPQGFLRRTALTRAQWEQYLRRVAAEACDRLHLIGSDLAAIAETLETHYTQALYRELKASAAGDGKAFAGAVLRLLNSVLVSLDRKHDDLRSTSEATWRAVGKLRKDLDVGRMVRAVDALTKAASGHADVLADLHEAIEGLPERLDRMEAALTAEVRAIPGKTIELLREGGLVLVGQHSNVSALGNRSFHGRSKELAALDQLLADPGAFARAVLHGPPGVGKSELAREHARRRADRYPGGTLFVEAAGAGIAASLTEVGRRLFGLHHPELPLEDQAYRVLFRLGDQPTLLLLDGVPDPETLAPWIPPASAACHVIATTNHGAWDRDAGPIRVDPLERADARKVVEELAPDSDPSSRERVIEHAGGVVQQLVPQAKALARATARGRSSEIALTAEATDSYSASYQHLDEEARLLLHALSFLVSASIPQDELQLHLEPLGWTESEFRAKLDRCLDESLVDFVVCGVKMHQLVMEFLGAQFLSESLVARVILVRQRQRARLLELAELVSANPADSNAALRLGLLPVEPDRWERAGASISKEDGESLGKGLCEIGRFEEALPWYERAAAAKEGDDVHDRVDHGSLGGILHQVGYCHSSLGRFDEGLRWFMRAIAAAEQGDVHGRVDHESLGGSLHEVGYCHSSLGHFEEALRWFERAAVAAEQGDVHGRVDYVNLGASLNQVGTCHSKLGHFAKALPWYERAVAAKKRGDVHGRVDHESIGVSLHEVGYCHSKLGHFAEALPWYEDAVASAELGDVHGRVDHGSLGASLNQVGHCHSKLGRFAEALPWFKRAVTAAERGDVHGRIDHGSLGASLNQVGTCHSSLGRFAEALPWFERAVVAKEKGDVHGRVDYGSLGASLHDVGNCHLSLGHFAEALRSFERAVAAAERGDVHGRVDHGSLGRSLNQVGACHSSLGQFAEALPWYERAVAAKELGDVHGRVDQEGLAGSLRALAACFEALALHGQAEETARRADALVKRG